MKLKLKRWRDKAYEYLIEQGEATTTDLLKNMTNSEGRPLKINPKNKNQATQLLLRDDRFMVVSNYMAESGANASFARESVTVWRCIV